MLGAVAGPPGVAAGAILGGIGGDWAARGLYDVIFGDNSLEEMSGIDEYPEYDQITEINNIYLQPIET